MFTKPWNALPLRYVRYLLSRKKFLIGQCPKSHNLRMIGDLSVVSVAKPVQTNDVALAGARYVPSESI